MKNSLDWDRERCGDPFSAGVGRLNNIKVRFKSKGGTGIKSMGFEFEKTGNKVIDLAFG